ncbi:MAG: AMP-binding protein [Planctomycetota bacterium]
MPIAGWPTTDRDPQGRSQMARLREFLRRQIVPFHPYYRDLFSREKVDIDSLRTLSDLTRLPFSEKKMVAPSRENPDQPRSFVLQPTAETLRGSLSLGGRMAFLWKAMVNGKEAVREEIGKEYRPVQVFFTTGRTSLPTSFFLSRYDLNILERVGARIAALVQVDPAKDKLLSLFPYAPHLAFWQVQTMGVASGTFTLQTGGGKVMGTDGIIQTIGKMKPTFLCGIPGYVYHVVREAVEEGVDLSSVSTVFLGGDRMVGGYRDKLKELLSRGGSQNPRVLSVLGFTEARKCWSECPGGEATGFHTYPDLEIFEIVDPDSGKQLPEGSTGELVYTPLDGRGSIVLRYRTGDIVSGGITHEPCPACGLTVPRFSSDLSRRSNVTDFSLTKIKGTLVNLNLLADILNGHPAVDEWQLVVRKRNDDPFDVDEMELAVALGSGREENEIVPELCRRVREALEVRLSNTEVLSRAELLERLGMETRLKENRIVDLRPKGAASPSSGSAKPSEPPSEPESAEPSASVQES